MRKKIICVLTILIISVMIAGLSGISEALLIGASDYTGYRTADPADPYYGIYATDGWGDGSDGYFVISWIIEYNLSYPKPYKYEYTFEIPDAGGLSHFIIEVSENTTRDDFSPDPGDDLKLYEEGSPSNPGLPADLFGIKMNTSGQSGTQTYIIYSERAPMWGDLYAKDGVLGTTGIDIYAYNLGIGTEPTSGDSSFNDWIAVPDTVTVIPEPGTLILMILGMMGFAGAGLKKKINK